MGRRGDRSTPSESSMMGKLVRRGISSGVVALAVVIAYLVLWQGAVKAVNDMTASAINRNNAIRAQGAPAPQQPSPPAAPSR